MTTLDLLAIGRVSVDLYAEQPGVSMSQVTTFRKSIGGTATNVAVATARYGHRAALATRVGDDQFGRYVSYALEHTFGVDPRFAATHPTLKTPLAFAELDPPEDPTIIFYREPAAPDMEIEVTPELEAAVDDAEIFWVPASRFAFAKSSETVTALLERRARRPHTVLDLDWRPMFWDSEQQAHEAISPMPDHVSIAIGNRKECEIAVGVSDPDAAADRLLERGVDVAVVVHVDNLEAVRKLEVRVDVVNLPGRSFKPDDSVSVPTRCDEVDFPVAIDVGLLDAGCSRMFAGKLVPSERFCGIVGRFPPVKPFAHTGCVLRAAFGSHGDIRSTVPVDVSDAQVMAQSRRVITGKNVAFP